MIYIMAFFILASHEREGRLQVLEAGITCDILVADQNPDDGW
jgi:hypothetical protein